MLALDKRLRTCADMVSADGIVCDVATDHALLPAYLVQNGIKHVIASDINEGPLKSAENTLKKYEIAHENVTLIQSDGLDNVPSDGVSDVIIAGVGAELIINILDRADWVKNNVNLILQPMTHTPALRKWLYNHGYEIVEERAAVCDRFVYAVIKARYCGACCDVDDTFSYLGMIDPTAFAGRKYAKKQILRLEKAIEQIRKSNPLDPRAEHFSSVVRGITERLGKSV